MLGLLCPLQFVEPWQLDLQDVPIKEQDRVERLILRRGGDIASYSKIAQKGCYLGGAHVTRVAFVVEQDEASDPLQIRLLGADAVVTEADHFAYLIQ